MKRKITVKENLREENREDEEENGEKFYAKKFVEGPYLL
jgi:hypothetical protein